MGLRAKLAGAIFVVLAGAILAASVVDISWALDEIADEVIDSGNVVASETFEQVRAVLAHTHEDPTAAIRTDPNLMAGIESVQAFAKGIVFIDIDAAKGEVILGEQPGAAPAAPSIDALRGATQSHLPFELLHALWREHNYVVVRPLLINNQPFAVIRVGVSTALVNDDVHQLVWATLGAGLLIVLVAAGAGTAIGNLLSRSVVTSGGEQLASGGDEANLTVGGRDELGNLAEKFNRLSRQVLSE